MEVGRVIFRILGSLLSLLGLGARASMAKHRTVVVMDPDHPVIFGSVLRIDLTVA